MPTNKSILEKANLALKNGDNEGFLAYCTEDTQWEFVGDTILQGKEAVRQFMQTAYAEPPKFEVENLIEESNYLTAIGKIDIEDENDIAITYQYCDVWKFREGKMAELKAFVIKE